jgi:hypothetical protein
MLETDLQRESPPGHPFRPGTDVRYVRDEMRRIGRLTNVGGLAEAREACAALMFDFQVIIVRRPHLAWQFAQLLGRCGAVGLSTRFQVAAGFNRIGVPRPAESVGSSAATASVPSDSWPERVLMGELTTD